MVSLVFFIITKWKKLHYAKQFQTRYWYESLFRHTIHLCEYVLTWTLPDEICQILLSTELQASSTTFLILEVFQIWLHCISWCFNIALRTLWAPRITPRISWFHFRHMFCIWRSTLRNKWKYHKITSGRNFKRKACFCRLNTKFTGARKNNRFSFTVFICPHYLWSVFTIPIQTHYEIILAKTSLLTALRNSPKCSCKQVNIGTDWLLCGYKMICTLW
jgi:hypothetical protein